MLSTLRGLVWVVLAAGIGLTGGCLGGSIGHIHLMPSNYPFLAEYIPLPHHVPKYPGGASFRFAMAHDVLHERFPKHGPAHYRERNRLTREQLARLAPDDPAAFPLADDLGAGLDRLGQVDEAAAVLRDKLARQLARGLSGRELYTSYANLGTFLLHGSASKALAGDAPARERFREGVALICRAVAVNPQAHFGREQWQAAINEFLLAAMDKPELLRTFDFLGNRLDLGIENILDHQIVWMYGRSTTIVFRRGWADFEAPALFKPGLSLDDPGRWAEVSPVRQFITKVGAEKGWEAVPVPSHRAPVPFDEPVLGMIGIWRQGSGANPHFALALGETMLRVGQRYLAWEAYERAARMANRFGPDPALQHFLRDHCRRRQSQIAGTLDSPDPDSVLDPAPRHLNAQALAEVAAGLRLRFEAELTYGESYQKAYQSYEEEKIAQGVPLSDEHFFDAFHAGREPIASPPGPEEWFKNVPWAKVYQYAAHRRWAWGVFGAGLAALAAALVLRLWPTRRAPPPPSLPRWSA